MPALPPTSDFTGAATQALSQVAYGGQRDFLAGTLGTDGTVATALATLGALLGKYAAKTAAYSVIASDRGTLINATIGTWTLSLVAASTAGAGFSFAILNTGPGVITVDPNGSELIDGVAAITLATGAAALVICTGTGWFSLPLPGSGQTSATDATAGRVLRNNAAGGAFGLGNVGTLSVVSNFDAINIPQGAYAFDNTTTGTRPADVGPTIRGILEVFVFDNGTIQQRLRRNSSAPLSGGYYARTYGSGAWGSWDVTVMRSSLLGTVAQTGGVPTGGVMERGSNANGEYVKFADGTLICTVGNLSAANASTALGSLFRSADIAWTFPAAFVGTTHLSVQADCDDADCWGTANTVTASGCNIRVLAGVTKAAAINGRATATGRWF